MQAGNYSTLRFKLKSVYPAPDYEFEKTVKNEVTEYVPGELNITEIFVSGYRDCELALSYQTGTAVKRDKIY